MKLITVEIDQEGNASVDLKGFHGKGCDGALKDFTDGAKIRKTTTKAEYHQVERQEVKQC